VVVAMIGAADGRATVDGRAGGLGSAADRGVLRGLRAVADALLVGSRTLVVERYATLLDPGHRDERRARGAEPTPVLATISRRADPALFAVPVFGEPDQRIVVCTESVEQPPQAAAQVEFERFPAGELSAAACLGRLRKAGAELVVSEGGPTLLRELLAAGLVDDLVLTIAPALVAGGGKAVVEGAAFDPPLALELRSAHCGDDHLFLHYAPAS
jgi:riboflavin biosynthesis pyrimidine reductase